MQNLASDRWCHKGDNLPVYDHVVDQRVRGWLLLDNYSPTFVLTVMYLLIVWIGPKYMRNRQPYSCRGLLLLYNLGLTLLSFYMFYEVIISKDMSKICGHVFIMDYQKVKGQGG